MQRLLELIVVHIERVVRIARPCEPRATAYLLAGGLAEGCRIGEATMVEDIVGTDTRYPHIDATERHSLKQFAIDAIAQLHIAYLIIIARTPIKDIDTYLRGIDAQIELILQAVVAKTDVLNIKGVA